jgi:hypothetical protein
MPLTPNAAACKRTGKGTEVEYQPACEANPSVPDYATDGSSADWVNVGCLFGVQPPGITYDTVTGETCLNETAAPTSELGDIQADNPTFTFPFCPDDADYQLLEDIATAGSCLLIRFTYPGGQEHFFFGFIQSMIPDEIDRNTFMRTPVTLLRTSSIYRLPASIPATGDFDCASCRETSGSGS